MKRMFCESALGQVHCVVAGEGAGAPLLLLHQTPRSTDGLPRSCRCSRGSDG